jgi:hypothetical protein
VVSRSVDRQWATKMSAPHTILKHLLPKMQNRVHQAILSETSHVPSFKIRRGTGAIAIPRHPAAQAFAGEKSSAENANRRPSAERQSRGMVARDTEFQVGGVINFRTLDGALAIPIDLSVDRSVDVDTLPGTAQIASEVMKTVGLYDSEAVPQQSRRQYHLRVRSGKRVTTTPAWTRSRRTS